jgi:hypothetical protein
MTASAPHWSFDFCYLSPERAPRSHIRAPFATATIRERQLKIRPRVIEHIALGQNRPDRAAPDCRDAVTHVRVRILPVSMEHLTHHTGIIMSNDLAALQGRRPQGAHQAYRRQPVRPQLPFAPRRPRYPSPVTRQHHGHGRPARHNLHKVPAVHSAAGTGLRTPRRQC